MSYSQVLQNWIDDEGFRTFFAALLADAPFAAYRWETPPLTRTNVNLVFEFVLIDCPGLNRPPDSRAFDDEIGTSTAPAVAFPNLGGDATLIVPRQMADPDVYVHLSSFLRRAPREQVHALFQLLGQTVRSRLSDAPLWLSTAGMGVAWLHIRLDSRPKYYGHAPYTRNAQLHSE